MWLLFFTSSKPNSESEVTQSCPTLCDPMDRSLPGSTVHGIFQASILEWAAISFCKWSSQPRDRTRVSCIADRRFTVWATNCNTMVLMWNYPMSWKILKLSLYFDWKQQKPCRKWLKQVGALSSESTQAWAARAPLGLRFCHSSNTLFQVGIPVTFQAGERAQKTEWAS